MQRTYLLHSVMLASLCFFSSLPTYAAMSGTLYFYGKIVEPSCRVSHETSQLNIDCSARGDRTVNSDAVVASTEWEYLDNEKTLAIAHITYR